MSRCHALLLALWFAQHLQCPALAKPRLHGMSNDKPAAVKVLPSKPQQQDGKSVASKSNGMSSKDLSESAMPAKDAELAPKPANDMGPPARALYTTSDECG